MERSPLTDALTVAVVAVSSLAAVIAGASPTGSDTIDALLVGLAVAVVVGFGAVAPPWSTAAALLLAGALSASWTLAVFTVVAFAAAIAAQWRWPDQPVAGAVTAGVAMNVAARSDLDLFLGSSAVVAVAIGLLIVVAGALRSSRRVRIAAASVGAVVGAVAVVGVAATALAGQAAVDDLQDAEDSTDAGLRMLGEGDVEGATLAFETARDQFADIESSLSGPLTAPAAIVPVVAQHRRAVVDVSGSAAAAAERVVLELEQLDLDAVTSGAGGVDVDAVRALERPLTEISAALDDLAGTVEEVRNPWLAAPVEDRLDELAADLDEELARGDDALELVRAAPDLLGATEPRTYFVAFMTPSEVRGLGGFMGNFAEITIDDGAIELTDFGRTERLARRLDDSPTSPDFGGLEEWTRRYGQFGFTAPGEPVVDPDAADALPGNPGSWGNVTMSPQADSTGDVVSRMYPLSGGRPIDGFFAMDVVAVSQLLEFTGPIRLSDGTMLSTENATEFLLNGQYRIEDRPERAELLEEVSRTVVDELLGGSLPDPQDLFDALGPMVEEGRLSGWAADEDEQRLFETFGLAGGLPDPGDGDALAITFNNAAGNKIDYFLRARASYDVTADVSSSTVDGTVLLELENRRPPNSQPDYVMGNLIGLPRGHNRTWVSVYTRLPAVEVTVDGRPVAWESGQEAGYFVASLYVTTSPDQIAAVEVDVAGELDLTDGYELTLWSPPTARTTPVSADVAVVDAAGEIVTDEAETTGGAVSVSVPTTAS